MHHCHDCHDNKRFLPVCQVRLSCQHPGAVALLRHRLSPPFPTFPRLSPRFCRCDTAFRQVRLPAEVHPEAVDRPAFRRRRREHACDTGRGRRRGPCGPGRVAAAAPAERRRRPPSVGAELRMRGARLPPPATVVLLLRHRLSVCVSLPVGVPFQTMRRDQQWAEDAQRALGELLVRHCLCRVSTAFRS